MSLTYGFYNSENGDRRYNAEQMSSIFDGIVTDGIFGSIGDKFMVYEASGMSVAVGSGRAWLNHIWTFNDSPLVVNISSSSLTLNRIDTVVIDVNKQSRVNSITVVQGTPASTPTAPVLTVDAHNEHYQYPLCDIYVAAGVTKITQSNITNRVGIDTPFAALDAEGNKLPLAGGTMTGDIAMGSNKITSSYTPTNSNDLVNKNYVDSGKYRTRLIRLWVNASPNSSFPEQTISGDIYSGMVAILITFRESTTFGYENTIILPVNTHNGVFNGSSGICSFDPYIGASGHANPNTYSRQVDMVMTSDISAQLKFYSGYNSEKNATDDSKCYPVRVWAIAYGEV